MKRILCLTIFAIASLKGEDLEETLFVRRIAEFQKDQESQLVKMQILEFLQSYPHSSYRDSLLIVLGDTYRSEGRYEDALKAYEAILDTSILKKAVDSYLDTLMQLGRDGEIIAFVNKLPEDETGPTPLYFKAEALYRESKEDPQKIAAAKETYRLLLATAYAEAAKSTLAELSLWTGDLDAALNLYLELADEQPDKKNVYNLQAARILLNDKPEDAIKLLQGTEGNDSNFLLGRGYFALKDYRSAYDKLAPLANSEQDNEAALLFMLAVSAHYLNDPPLMNMWGRRFIQSYPDDLSASKIRYLLAVNRKKEGQLEEATALLKDILVSDPSFNDLDTVYFELGRIAHASEDWKGSHAYFSQLLNEIPESPHASKARIFLQQNTQKLLERSDDLVSKEQLAEELAAILALNDDLSPQMRANYQMKRAKTLYALQRYQEAETSLNDYLLIAPNDDQAYLLLAMCEQKCGNDSRVFIKLAEKALSLNPSLSGHGRVKLHLYNAYLKLSQEDDSYRSQAVNYLYDAAINGEEKVKTESLLWLANYFYNQAREGIPEHSLDPLESPQKIILARKGAEVFEAALLKDGKLPPLSPATLQLEGEAYKLSTLYAWLGKASPQEEILEELARQQAENPVWKWSLPMRVKFAWAYALYRQGFDNQALLLLEELANKRGIDPYVSSASKLLYARLSYLLLDDEAKKLDNTKMVAILKILKDLQIRKNAAFEPVHLEAALDYANIRSSVEPEDKRLDNYHFLLGRAKDGFRCQDDICSKDYHASLAASPEKKRVYDAYMMLIDALMADIEAKIAAAKGDQQGQALHSSLARSIYKNLQNDKNGVSKYLLDQAQSGLGGNGYGGK